MLKESGPYFRDPVALQNDIRYITLSIDQKGMFAELCDRQWTGHGLPDDPAQLMAILHLSDRSDFDRHWLRLGVFFSAIPGRAGLIFFLEMERDREAKQRKMKGRSKAGKTAAKVRWKKANQVQPIQENPSDRINNRMLDALTNASPNTISISKENTENPPNPPSGGTVSERPKDQAFELFVEMHDASKAPAKYPRDRKADFVHGAALKKAQGIGAREMPPRWAEACRNYLGSLRPKHTYADLCQHYATLVQGPVDRFGILITKGGSDGTDQPRNGNGHARTAATTAGSGARYPTYTPKQ